jgi:hypothetical protein
MTFMIVKNEDCFRQLMSELMPYDHSLRFIQNIPCNYPFFFIYYIHDMHSSYVENVLFKFVSMNDINRLIKLAEEE